MRTHKFNAAWLILTTLISLNHSLAFSEKKIMARKIPKSDKKVVASWLNVHRDLIKFPNGIKVDILIANSTISSRYIASISPDEQRLVIADIKRPGYNEKDLSIYDNMGNFIYNMQSNTDDPISGFWSHSSRYLLERLLFDIQTHKSLILGPEKEYSEWSLKDDRLVYSSQSTFKQKFISEVVGDHFIDHSATDSEVSILLGEGYLPSLQFAHKVSTIPPATRIGWYYQNNLYGRSIYTSPDGRRVLIQNICRHYVDWEEMTSVNDKFFYYIIDKHGLHLKDKARGLNEPVYIQWLDNRWLIGRTPNPLGVSADEYGKVSAKGVKLVLWDTDTGKHYYAPLPVQYEYDAMRCKLIPTKKSDKIKIHSASK